MNEKCPCIKCICMPICRTKNYTNLMKCTLVHSYVYDRLCKDDRLYTDRMRSVLVALEALWLY